MPTQAATQRKTSKRKPTTKKPYTDFPLRLHATGQWCKKIRQRTIYFGSDADAALKKYLEQRDDLQAGRTPRVQGDGLTVRDLCNRFLTMKKSAVDSEELSPRTFGDYYATCERLCDAFGKTRLVADLATDDFERLRSSFAKTRGLVGVSNLIRQTRIVFKYGYDAALIDKPVRFGPGFKTPTKGKLRKERQAKPLRMFEAAELRRLIDTAEQPMKAMILMAANCGFGQSDLANLPQAALNLDTGWVDFPRPKTGIQRRCPLWSETVTAIREAITKRPTAKDADDAGLVFITKYGSRWVRIGPKAPIDSVGLQFQKLVKELKLQRAGRGFYAIRHSFATVAGESRDQVAVNAIMGHSGGAADDIPGRYRERISDERLVAVSDHVRKWLFG
ncbi:MAG: tyrosine recombinase XerC [Planctomycetaceae bacterium]